MAGLVDTPQNALRGEPVGGAGDDLFDAEEDTHA